MKQIIRRVAALVIGLGLGAVSLAGLETVTHISDLNASWPLGSDLASTSDDHIRNIKSALKTDFPNVNGAVNPTPAQFNQLTSNTFTSAVTGNSFIPSSSTVPTNGIYLPSANTLGLATNSAARGSINSTGNWSISAPSTGTTVTVTGVSGGNAVIVASANATSSGQADIQVTRTGSTSNTVGIGPNLELLDTGATTASLWQHSGGQTELWQFNSGSWNQILKVTSTRGVSLAAPASGNLLTLAGTGSSDTILVNSNGTGSGLKVSGSAATQLTPLLFQQSGQSAWQIYQPASSNDFRIFGNSADRVIVTNAGAMSAGGATAGSPVDMTPDTGTFTATMTGGTTSPTCTARWTRVGNLVMLEICSATATSNATSFTYTGLPSAVQPSVTQHIPAASSAYEDNSATMTSTVEVVVTASSGTITFWKNGASTGWTNLNVKGITAVNTVSYLLN